MNAITPPVGPVVPPGEDYAFDVFISYRRMPFGQKWISEEFLDAFRERLQLEIGRKPDIFWDDASVDDGQVPKERVRDALRRSRCLLSILSGPYFSSAWCSAEWETFRLRAQAAKLPQGHTLTVPLRWHDGENYKELLIGNGPQPSDFSQFRLIGPAWHDTRTYVAFQEALNGLAETVGALLQRSPPFEPAWEIVDPDTLTRLGSPGVWAFKLGPDPTRLA